MCLFEEGKEGWATDREHLNGPWGLHLVKIRQASGIATLGFRAATGLSMKYSSVMWGGGVVYGFLSFLLINVWSACECFGGVRLCLPIVAFSLACCPPAGLLEQGHHSYAHSRTPGGPCTHPSETRDASRGCARLGQIEGRGEIYASVLFLVIFLPLVSVGFFSSR